MVRSKSYPLLHCQATSIQPALLRSATTATIFELVVSVFRVWRVYTARYIKALRRRNDNTSIEFLTTQQVQFDNSPRQILVATLHLLLVLALPISYMKAMFISYTLVWIIPIVCNWIRNISVYFYVRDVSQRPPEIRADWDSSTRMKKLDGLEIYQHTPLEDEQGFRCLLLKGAANKRATFLKRALQPFHYKATHLRSAIIYLGLRFTIPCSELLNPKDKSKCTPTSLCADARIHTSSSPAPIKLKGLESAIGGGPGSAVLAIQIKSRHGSYTKYNLPKKDSDSTTEWLAVTFYADKGIFVIQVMAFPSCRVYGHATMCLEIPSQSILGPFSRVIRAACSSFGLCFVPASSFCKWLNVASQLPQ